MLLEQKAAVRAFERGETSPTNAVDRDATWGELLKEAVRRDRSPSWNSKFEFA